MDWFWLSLIGQLSNGVTFILDKILLRAAFTRSATFAGLVGIMSFAVIVVFPFVDVWPHGGLWVVAAVSGITSTLALWAFFAALSRAEATRIVPIVGSLIPILTLAGAFVFLGERLSDRSFIGFAILIIATVMLTGGGKGRLKHDTTWLAITASFLFALSSITAKVTYDATGFLGGFLVTRIFAGFAGLLLLLVMDRHAGQEALAVFRPHRRTSKHKQPGRVAAIVAIFGQSLGAVGFLFIQWATSQGSPSLVNAMQAVQYALLVLVALALKRWAPQLLGEDLTRRTLIIKVSALLLCAVGMYLIV